MENSFTNVLFGMLFMIALLGGAWYLNKRVNNKAAFLRKSKYIKSLDRFALSRDRWIEVIEFNDKIYLIGISQNGVQNIDCIEKDQLKEIADSNNNDNSFKNILNKYINKR